MKTVFSFLLILNVGVSHAQSADFYSLIGEWKFVELRDEKGKPHKEIPIRKFGPNAMELVNRDNYIFNADSTYSGFNKFNVSSGKWFFDSNSEEINLELEISAYDPAFEILKQRDMIKISGDGKCYQKAIQIRVLQFEKIKMTLSDRENYVLIYEKIK